MKTSVGKDLKVPYIPAIALPLTISFKLPVLFRRGRAKDNEIDRIKSFFENEKGSIAVSQAACTTHRVDLSWKSSKSLTQSFIEAVKGLNLASNHSSLKKDLEFKRFVNEFGTHYQKSTILGVKLYSERRYSQKETEAVDDEDLKVCNTALAVKLIGMQIDPDLETCRVPEILFKNFKSKQLQRYVVTTSGSYAFTNGTEWSKQILDMHKNSILFPVPIKRKLRPIVELFFEKSLLVSGSIT